MPWNISLFAILVQYFRYSIKVAWIAKHMKLTMLAYTIIIRRIYVRMIGTERGDQRTDRRKPKPQKTSQSDHRTTVMSNSMKLSLAVWGHPRQTGHGGEVWQNVVHWRRGMENRFVILALITPQTVCKGKMIGHWKMDSPGPKVPNMLLEISGEITPERMKGWSQSKNNTQLWMWLVKEARSNAVKSNLEC